MARKKIFLILKIIISAAAVAVIFSQIDLKSFFSTVISADPLLLAAGFALAFLTQVLNALKIKLLLPGTAIGFRYILFTNFAAVFFRLTVPTDLGAELGRGYYFSKKTGSAATAFSAIIMDRYLGLFALAAVLGGASVVFGIGHKSPAWLYPGLASLLCALVLAGALALFSFIRGVRRSSRKGLARLTGAMHDFSGYVRAFRGMPLRLIAAAAVSIVFQCLVFSMLVVISAAYHETVGFHEAAAVAVASVIGAFIPVTVAGLGVVEGIYAAMFRLFSMQTEIGLAVCLSLRVISIVLAVPGALFFVYGERLIKEKRDAPPDR